MSHCECGNPKQHNATACARSRELERGRRGRVVQTDGDDEKRERDRQAQRKHRAKLRATPEGRALLRQRSAANYARRKRQRA